VELRAAVPAAAEVVAVNAGDHVDLGLAIAALHERGHAVIVSEAGPTLFGRLLAEQLVDELFLTVSPLVAGRGTDRRPGFAEGTELLPQTTEPAKLLSLRRSGSYLFLRYGFSRATSRVER
jgi:riboflavin biosynthesis pyrimidine reductase